MGIESLSKHESPKNRFKSWRTFRNREPAAIKKPFASLPVSLSNYQEVADYSK